jgi:hypothetical protein
VDPTTDGEKTGASGAATSLLEPEIHHPAHRESWFAWFDRPLTGTCCVLWWSVATLLFVGLVWILGGPHIGDAAQSTYSTWAIAHGDLACAYPPGTSFNFPPAYTPGPFIAPLWPLVSGGLAAVTGIGHHAAFPSQSAFGPGCSTALAAMYRWSVRSGASSQTLQLGYVAWLVLMAGAVALLRACGRGRCRWEPAALVMLACAPPVWMPLLQFFHPQDIMATGLALGALACVRRDRWVWAGVLVALALTSQQFTLLVLAPLIVVVPQKLRARFVGATMATLALVGVPLLAITSGRALRAMVLGASTARAGAVGQLVQLDTHVPVGVLVALARDLPIILSAAVAWCALRRLGPAVREPLPLLSLVATAFSLRLVFEVNYLYYFMPLAVSLILMDVIRRRIRWYLVIWIVLVTLAFGLNSWGFDPTSQPWGLHWRDILALSLMAAALAVVLVEAVRARVRWSVVASLVAAGLAIANLPPRGGDGVLHPLPDWLWMLTLLVAGVTMAVEPLISLALSRSSRTWHQSGPARIGQASPVAGKSAAGAGTTLPRPAALGYVAGTATGFGEKSGDSGRVPAL